MLCTRVWRAFLRKLICAPRQRIGSRLWIEQLEDRVVPATITWTNPGSGNWDVGANWNSGTVPGSGDTAVIDTTAAATVTIQSSDNVQVQGITLGNNDTLAIAGGSLQVTSGTSTLSGTLSVNGGNLEATGSGVVLSATGADTIAGANLYAENGATLSLPGLTSYTSGGNSMIEATGTGSVLTLANLASLTESGHGYQDQIQFEALAGGLVTLSALQQIDTGTVVLQSDGGGSTLNVSALTSFADSAGWTDSALLATDDGALSDSSLSTLSGANFNVSGASEVLTMTGLTAINGDSVTVSGGASLSLPGLTSYSSGILTTFEATGAGSVLTLASLTSVTQTGTGYQDQIQFEALAGGLVTLSSLQQIDTGTVVLESDGASSELDVSSLTSFVENDGWNYSTFQVSDSGTIADGDLTTLTNLNLNIIGNETIALNGLTSINNDNVTLNGGATLSLPGVTSYATGGLTTLEATGTGSVLTLANLTSVTESGTGYQDQIQFEALAGGTVTLSALTQIDTGTVVLESDGASSELDVSTLTSIVENDGWNYSTFQVSDSGTIADGDLTTLTGVNLNVSSGSISLSALTTFNYGGLAIDGSGESETLVGITTFNDANVTVSGGGTLSLPGLTSYTSAVGTTLEATGTDSVLTLANLKSVTESGTGYQDQIQFEALAGGLVTLSSLQQIDTGTVILESDGNDSNLNVSALTSFIENGGWNYSSLQASNSGTLADGDLATLTSLNFNVIGSETIALSGLTSIDYDNVTVSGGATLSLPGVTSYTNSGYTTLEASGTGSDLTLANLTSVIESGHGYQNQIQFEALAGADVTLSALQQIDTGTVILESDGSGSDLDVSSLTSFDDNGGWTNSTLQASNGGAMAVGDLTALTNLNFNIIGNETIAFSGLTSLNDDNVTVSSGATLSLPGVTTISGGGVSIGSGSTLSLGQSSLVNSNNAFVINNGGTLQLGSTTIAMPAAGGGTTIAIPQIPSGIPITLQNDGAFTGGTTFNIATGDEITLSGDGSYTGGVAFNVGQGATVNLTENDQLNYGGTLTGSGPGAVQFQSGGIDPTLGGLTLDFPGSMFQWTGGAFFAALGNVTNLGTINLSGSNDKGFYDDATLDNYGTLIQTGTGNLTLHSDNISPTTLVNEAGATYLIESDSGIDNTYGGQVAVENAGIIRKTAGIGASLLYINGPFSNTGTIEADSGTLDIDSSSITQISSAGLTGGAWNALDGATLAFPSGTAITSNAASISLGGNGASILGISGLASNSGSFTIAAGATFAASANFNNSGNLTLGGKLTAPGNFSQTSSGVLNEQIAGLPSSGLFGQVVASGIAALAGSYNITLANGFAPFTNQTYQAMSFRSESGDFTAFNLGKYFSESLTGTNLNLVSASPNPTNLSLINVTAPTTATNGQDITVNWQATNQSANAATGNWLDAVYLSTTPTITSSSTLLGSVQHTGGLAANGSYSASLTATLPALPSGNYYVLVEADSLDQLNDANRANGTMAAITGQLALSVQALTLGTPATGSFTAADQNQYYQVTVPAGGSLSIAVSSAASSGSLAVYVSPFNSPTAYNYQYAANAANQPSQTVIVPQIAAAATYYILVQSVAGSAATANYSLTVTQTSVVTVDASPTAYLGGNGGTLTIPITGTNFSVNTTARLALGGTTIPAASIDYVNAGEIYATFNVTGASIGSYTLNVSTSSQSVTSPTPVQITAAVNSSDAVQLTLSTPSSVRAGRDGDVVVTATNTSNNDVLAPLLELTADGATLKLPSQPTFEGNLLYFLGASPTGPAGILTPGESVQVTVEFESTTTGPSVNFQLNQADDSQPMDWASQESSLRIPTIPNAAWPIVYANFTAAMGSTVASYHAVIAADATYLAQMGEPTNDVLQLVEFELEKANAAYSAEPTLETVAADSLPAPGMPLTFQQTYLASISGRYYEGILGGQGWTTNWDITATTTSTGDVAIQMSGAYIFFFQQTDGSYEPEAGDESDVLTVTSGAYRFVEGNGTVYQFNPNGTLAYEADPNGNRITATYNAASQLSELTDSNGSYLQMIYNAQGRLSTLTDSNGQQEVYQYTGAFLTSYSDVYGTTNYSYVTGGTPAQNGALDQIAFADDTHIYFGYDSQGRLDDQHRDDGAQDTQYRYLSPGGVETINGDGSTSTTFTNEYGNTTETIDGAGNAIFYIRDADLNVVEVIAPGNRAYQLTYDANGNSTSQTDPLGQTTSFTYNTNNDLTSYTNALGDTTSYVWDNQDNLLSVSYANGATEQYTYNPLGEATDFLDADGDVINETYNSDGLVQKESFNNGTSYSFTYNAQGNITSSTDGEGNVTTFLYGDTSNPYLLTEVEYPDSTWLKFTYNVVGQRTQSVDQTGYRVDYLYDSAGRLSELTDANGDVIVQYLYDGAGNVSQKNNGNGTFTIYSYDVANRVASITNYAPSTGAVAYDPTTSAVNSFDVYTYDASGNVLTDTDQDGAWSYGYNADSELTSAVFTPSALDPDGLTAESIQYVYDGAGNRISQTVNGVVTTFAVNTVNEITASTTVGLGTTDYQYDLNGNMTGETDSEGNTTSYSYNELNELIGVSGPSVSASYAYNPLGNLVSQTVNGDTTNYQVDPLGLGNIVAAFSGSGEYNDAGGLMAHYTYGLALVSQVGSNGAASYYDFGLTGNTIGITGASGAYVNKYAYMPFGQTTTLSQTLTNPFTFIGSAGVMDDGVGLDFMRARSYDPATGQFTSIDPLGLYGKVPNLRLYAENNPLLWNDPSGLCDNDPCWGFAPGLFHWLCTVFHWPNPSTPLDPVTKQPPPQGDAPNSGGGTPCGCPPDEPPGVPPESPPGTGPRGTTPVRTPHDPNALVGPSGYGSAEYIADSGNLPYTIDFENDGTVAADNVIVSEQLDPNLDWSTFQLGSFGFGSLNITVPEGLTQYQTMVSYENSDGSPLKVLVSLLFNVQSGLLTASFTSLDPATGETPTGVFDGFLYPESDNALDSDGYLEYTIQPKASLNTGATINQQASVVFDTNAAIDTNTVTNTVQATPPTSSVNVLANTVTSNFAVSWSGNDASGIASYTISVSTNDSAYTPWITDTSATSGVFTGTVGDTYSFYSVATDNVGLSQATPSSAQATTKVVAQPAFSLSKSTVTLSPASIASGSTTTITLQAVSAAGQKELSGGLNVAFSLASKIGGQGTFSAITDNGNGTYTATFTGTIAGSNTILATINVAKVASVAPKLTVTPGSPNLAKSTLKISAGSIKAGSAITLTVQPEDAAGNKVNEKGLVVGFLLGNGVGQGTFTTAKYNANGAYTATFTGSTAGSDTITATIGGDAITSTAPTITVTPGPASASKSVVTLSGSSIVAGGNITATFQAVDASGNKETTGGLKVAFVLGKSTGAHGTFSAVTDHKNGTYTATFTGTLAGSNTIEATISGVKATSTAPAVSVSPGAVSLAKSVVMLSAASVKSGDNITVTLQARDAYGNDETAGGLTVAFALASLKGGQGTFSSVTDNGNGTYTATFTATTSGTNTIEALIGGDKVASTAPAIKVIV